jgi:hypothetical protein
MFASQNIDVESAARDFGRFSQSWPVSLDGVVDLHDLMMKLLLSPESHAPGDCFGAVPGLDADA